MPALLTSPSRRPWRSSAASTTRCGPSGSAKSACTEATGAPSRPASWSTGDARVCATTSAPAAMSRRAMPVPMPPPAPVTTMTRPSNRISSSGGGSPSCSAMCSIRRDSRIGVGPPESVRRQSTPRCRLRWDSRIGGDCWTRPSDRGGRAMAGRRSISSVPGESPYVGGGVGKLGQQRCSVAKLEARFVEGRGHGGAHQRPLAACPRGHPCARPDGNHRPLASRHVGPEPRPQHHAVRSEQEHLDRSAGVVVPQLDAAQPMQRREVAGPQQEVDGRGVLVSPGLRPLAALASQRLKPQQLDHLVGIHPPNVTLWLDRRCAGTGLSRGRCLVRWDRARADLPAPPRSAAHPRRRSGGPARRGRSACRRR